MSRETLARQQAALVAALVAGAPLPAGFDPDRVRAAGDALLRKRAGEVARTWPALRASYGPQWIEAFAAYARTRPTRGSLRDGWDLARQAAARGELDAEASRELAGREATWRYDGDTAPRRHPAPRRAGTALRRLGGRVRGWSPTTRA